MERFIVEGKKLEKNNKKVINWDDINKIILVLILFVYFNKLTSDSYNMIKYSLKILVLLIIIQSIFKDTKIFKILKNLIYKIINIFN